MRKKYGRESQKKEARERRTTWLIGALTDLGIGLILILIQKLLD